jgi:integrase
MATWGLWWGEPSGLRLGRIDREQRLLHVVETVTEVRGKLAADTPKSAASSRTIPLAHAAYTAVLGLLAIRLCGRDDYVLHTASGAPVPADPTVALSRGCTASQ